MKEIMVRASIKYKNIYNDGYIYIKKDTAEGVFTLDYLYFHIEDEALYLDIYENLDDKFSFNMSSYSSLYPYKTFVFTDYYILKDPMGNELHMRILSVVDDLFEIEEIKRKIDAMQRKVS